MDEKLSFMGRIVDSFLRGNLAVLLMIISLVAGAVALLVTPREEDPQIVVPLADVMVSYPGGSAEEVERLVASRLERMLYQIDGVEYVYSLSRPGMAVVTVRFYVGQDREASLIKLYNKIFQNIDKTTPGIAGWVVKPVEIDDVPIVNVALYSDRYTEPELYRVAEEAASRLQHIENSARVTIHGGQKRQIQISLDPERLAAYQLSPMEIAGALKVANVQTGAGAFQQADREVLMETGPFLASADEVRNLMVGLHAGRPVYLRDVAGVTDGPEEAVSYSRIGFGPGEKGVQGSGSRKREHPLTTINQQPSTNNFPASFPAVTIAVAKKKGSNAVWVAHDVEKLLGTMRGDIIPDEVKFRVTRNTGETANEKVSNLLESLVIAVITVIGLIALAMNWRVGLIVVIAVPITYALTLVVNYLAGYTINRVTLFALILALGLLVDDPIVGVENIYRHLAMRKLPRLQAISLAMNEVMPPVVLATLAVIVAFLPMFFITGMMGPYMRPMALNVPLAMLSSLIVAVAITPWLSNKLLKVEGHEHDTGDVRQTLTYRVYSKVMLPLVQSRSKTWVLAGITAFLFAGSLVLALTGLVPLKMLPFDNKNEFQIVVDLPESATLERTDAVVREIETLLRSVPEVTDFTSTVGAASPMDFNGLVRHYYLRQGANVADVRVSLLPRKEREMDSHALVLRLRNDIAALAERTGSSLKLVELPPGPPVLSTLVAEVYGRPDQSYDQLIAAGKLVGARMRKEPGVVDVDDSVEAAQDKFFFRVDRDKAARNGIATADIVQSLQMALSGLPAGALHVPTEQNELPIVIKLPREKRSDLARLATLTVKGRGGVGVQLGELGAFEAHQADKSIMHKNQERVVFVTGEMAGRGPAYAVLALESWFKKNPLPAGIRIDWAGEGEWKITVDVFRDLGLAFAAALIGIYVLLAYQTGSYVLPGIIMLSIPLTMIGIMPGFWLLNALGNKPVGGFDNPVFFTATAMIGMIALAGIVVRNGIILVDFIKTAEERGASVKDAILESGAVRFRPIALTAAAALLGAWPITLDPIFSGLAWSLIFGLFVSTVFTLVVIPLVYFWLIGGKKKVLTEQNPPF
ncbi:MAG: efflux RND transporter permease subunit [bacterium]